MLLPALVPVLALGLGVEAEGGVPLGPVTARDKPVTALLLARRTGTDLRREEVLLVRDIIYNMCYKNL